MDFNLSSKQKQFLENAISKKYNVPTEMFEGFGDYEIDEAPGYYAALVADIEDDMDEDQENNIFLTLASEIAEMPEYKQIEEEIHGD